MSIGGFVKVKRVGGRSDCDLIAGFSAAKVETLPSKAAVNAIILMSIVPHRGPSCEKVATDELETWARQR